MKTAELMFGWKIEYPEILTIFQNEDGTVAVMNKKHVFGIIQSFVFQLSEKQVTCQSNPDFIQRFTISINKTIRIETPEDGTGQVARSIGVIGEA